jgi:hypothetical protein
MGVRNRPRADSSCSSVSADPIRKNTLSTRAGNKIPHVVKLFSNFKSVNIFLLGKISRLKQ